MTTDRSYLTALTITESAAHLVKDLCVCGGQEERTVWRMPGDLRNKHDANCPSVRILSRLPGVERDAVARALSTALTDGIE